MAGERRTFTGRNPLIPSRKRVAMPRIGAVRATLVAPMFPLPDSRISLPFTMRTRMYPKGIEPQR